MPLAKDQASGRRRGHVYTSTDTHTYTYTRIYTHTHTREEEEDLIDVAHQFILLPKKFIRLII